jgi:hypothetical protein
LSSYFINSICPSFEFPRTPVPTPLSRAAPMPKAPPIQPIRIAPQHNQPTLSRGQKAFNTLVAKIEGKRKQLLQWQTAVQSCQQKAAGELTPLVDKFRQQQVAMVHALDQALGQKGLTKPERAMAQELLCDLAEHLVCETGDEALKAIYNKHSASDFDADATAAAESLKNAMEGLFGFDLGDTAELNSPDDLMAHVHQHMQQQADQLHQEDQARQDKRSQRKKTPKQLAREEQLKAEADQTSLSIREVYRKLVSALHPDREPDLEERQRKTILMQRVNQAYDKKDLLQLLELQLELEHIDAHSIAGLSEERLKHFNKVLREQLAELEQEIAHVELPLRAQLNLSPYQALTPASVITLLTRDIADLKRQLKEIKTDLHIVSDPVAFKLWLKACRRQAKAAQRDEIDDFPFF